MAPKHKLQQEVNHSSELAMLIDGLKAGASSRRVVKQKRFHVPWQHKSRNKLMAPPSEFRKNYNRLMALPGELRNMIYRHVLVEQGRIVVRSTGPGQPGLLAACKAIRKEAGSIYYIENEFTLLLTDFDGAAFSHFKLQYDRCPTIGRMTHYYQFGGRPNWANLVRWLEEAYFGRCWVPLCQIDYPILREHYRHHYVVGGAFKLLKETRALGWDGVERVLEAYLHGLKGTTSRWADDEYDF